MCDLNYGVLKHIQEYAQLSKQRQFNFQGYGGLLVMVLGFTFVTTYFALNMSYDVCAWIRSSNA